jgi:dipeptidyl aminopeptidase/acylaminoacyl peptidase
MKNKLYPLERYLSVQSASSPRFSSDGKKIYFTTNITGITQLFSIPVKTKGSVIPWPDQITFGAERIISYSVEKPKEGGRIIYTRDLGGNENAQLSMINREGMDVKLTEGHETAMHGLGQWSDDGKRLLFSANRRDKGLFDLHITDFKGNEKIILKSDEPGYLQGAKFSPDETKVIVIKNTASFQNFLLEVDLTDGSYRVLGGAEGTVRFNGVEYSKDGSFLYLVTDYNSDFLYIAKLDLTTLNITPLIAREWDIEKMKLSDSQKFLAYSFNVDGFSELAIKNLESGTEYPLPKTDTPGIMGGLDFSQDESRVVFSMQSASRTGDIYSWEFSNSNYTAVTRSSHAGIPISLFQEPQLIHYSTFDSKKIPAYYFPPISNEVQSPVIVLVHGGPEGQARPAFNGLIQYFLHSGFAVFIPNVRGSTGYGKTYSHLDDVEKRMDSVADLEYGTHWLKEQAEIDSEGLIVYGGSYGGFMVLSALTEYPETWAAGVDIVGISNFVTFLENTSSYRRAHREAEYGSLKENRNFLEGISPIRKVNRIKAPLFVIHGANDPRVPLSEAEQLVSRIQGRGVPVKLMVFDDEGHGLAKLKNKLKAYPEMVTFLKQHV